MHFFIFLPFLALLSFLPVYAVGETAPVGLFGSKEIRSTQLGAFKKWNGMLTRGKIEQLKAEQNRRAGKKFPCRVTKSFRCPVDEWNDLLKSLKGKKSTEQMDAVNRHMNHALYITDIINWGVQDYWASLRQFFRKDGDCEDYAIAKYFSLKNLGFNPDNMRIAVVQDTNLDVAHAVLVVYVDNKTWILDNQIPQVVREKNILHYKPLYSINETAWWLHRM